MSAVNTHAEGQLEAATISGGGAGETARKGRRARLWLPGSDAFL